MDASGKEKDVEEKNVYLRKQEQELVSSTSAFSTWPREAVAATSARIRLGVSILAETAEFRRRGSIVAVKHMPR